MSVPGNINTAPPPSSFDDDADFYEESRWQKLKRKLIEEPLIPLGCGLTCWALIEATRSVRSGDKHRTNRMFRRRIYAQAFTILAMLGGSAYWEVDRKKRQEYQGLIDEKQKKEKHEAWLKELEARDEEEQELRRLRDKIIKGQAADRQRALAGGRKDADNQGGSSGAVRCALEESESRRGPILTAVQSLWNRNR